jgi:hypothetical protein
MEEDDFVPVSATTTFFGSSSLILPNPWLHAFSNRFSDGLRRFMG